MERLTWSANVSKNTIRLREPESQGREHINGEFGPWTAQSEQ